MAKQRKGAVTKSPLKPAPKKVIIPIKQEGSTPSDKLEDQKPPVDPAVNANPSDKLMDQKPPIDPAVNANLTDKLEGQKPPVDPVINANPSDKLEDKKAVKKDKNTDHKDAAKELFERTSYDVIFSNRKGEFFSTENTALLSCESGEKPVRHDRVTVSN